MGKKYDPPSAQFTKEEKSTKISVIIPTCEAAGFLKPLMDKLYAQTVPPDEIVVVDSESGDNTPEIARCSGAKVFQISRHEFDHGGTRDMALRQSMGDVVLFLTQDALPVDESYIERLIEPFSNDRIAAVSGRQVARPDARPFEKMVREFSYPSFSRTWDRSAIASDGVRAFLLSDVCSAYRRSAYEAVGGFDHPLLTNEDMLIASKLLDSGYSLAYAGGAAVYHSHSYTFRQEYRRNHLIGQFMQRYEKELHYAKETGHGLKLVKYVAGQLIKQGQFLEIPAFFFNCAARLLGNRMGRRKERTLQSHAKS